MEQILDYLRNKMNPEQYEKLEYLYTNGKRIRPQLMENICKQLGKDFTPLIPAASGVELLHCISLVHDDIVDEAEKRRGGIPFYKKFGTPAAVLFGDFFAITAFETFVEQYSKEIHLSFVKTFRSMIEGQLMELDTKITDLPTYFDYIEKKTISLFELCAQVPFLYYGINDPKILDFVKEFGTLFQITNDLAEDKELGILLFMSESAAQKMAKKWLNKLKSFGLKQMESSLQIFNNL